MGLIGIINPGGVGDILLSTSVLKYRDRLWPGKEVVWYCHKENAYVLSRVKGIKEVRAVLAANGQDYRGLYDADIEKMVVAAPWLHIAGISVPIPAGMPFVQIHRFIFETVTGIGLGEWHPCLEYSKEDDDVAETVMGCLPFKKTVMLETAYYSNQSFLDEAILVRMMDEIRREWGDCNFLFASGKRKDGTASLPDGKGVFSCSKLPLWMLLALFNRVDAFVGVSSGISCAVCSWAASESVPRLELIRNPIPSTEKCSRGPISTAYNSEELFAKLPLFLRGKFDFVPGGSQ